MALPVIVLGGGGHARVVVDCLRRQGHPVAGFTDPDPAKEVVLGVPRLGTDEAVLRYAAGAVLLANGVGMAAGMGRRSELFERFRAMGYRFCTVVHPSAVLGAEVRLEAGVQVMAGAVVQPGTWIGENAVVNTRASVDHDCVLGAHCHVAPGAVLAGGVRVGEGALVGVGASVLQGVRVGRDGVVGAGAVVVRDVPEGATVVGVPARPSRQGGRPAS